jgi:DNA polymerase/3'-5' exonuclease PolX
MIDVKTPTQDDEINYNQKITDVLEQLIYQIQLEQIIDGDQKHGFRLRNIKRGIKLISSMVEIHELKDLVNVRGIGDGIRRRVGEILKTGTLDEVQSVNEEVRAICKLGKVHGIGPKLLGTLYHKGIRSITDLQTAIATNTLPEGVKIFTPSRIALRYHHDLAIRIPRELIDRIRRYLQDHIPVDSDFQVAGSYRRGAKTSGDIDILVMSSDSLPSLAPLIQALQDDGFLVAQLSGGSEKYNGICYFNGRYCRIDFLLTRETEYYPALLHFTGSGLFNQIIRWHANKQGYKLSNLGVSWRPGDDYPERKPIPTFDSEKAIFDFLGIRYLKPAERDL